MNFMQTAPELVEEYNHIKQLLRILYVKQQWMQLRTTDKQRHVLLFKYDAEIQEYRMQFPDKHKRFHNTYKIKDPLELKDKCFELEKRNRETLKCLCKMILNDYECNIEELYELLIFYGVSIAHPVEVASAIAVLTVTEPQTPFYVVMRGPYRQKVYAEPLKDFNINPATQKWSSVKRDDLIEIK